MAAIRKSIVVDTSVAKVWDAITDRAKLSSWYMETDDFEPTVGSRFQFRDEPQGKWDGKIQGEVTEVREQEVLAYTFTGNQMSYVTTVRWTLENLGEKTRVTIDHTGFEGFSGLLMKLIIQFGWRKFLNRLVESL